MSRELENPIRSSRKLELTYKMNFRKIKSYNEKLGIQTYKVQR